jgi:hypothetical protein
LDLRGANSIGATPMKITPMLFVQSKPRAGIPPHPHLTLRTRRLMVSGQNTGSLDADIVQVALTDIN